MAVLGELEHRIMAVLWASDQPVSVRTVHETLQADKDLAYTTVMTVLDRLAKKGLVLREQQGRAWIYRPAQSQADLLAAEIVQVLAEAEGKDAAVWQAVLAKLGAERAQILRQAATRAER